MKLLYALLYFPISHIQLISFDKKVYDLNSLIGSDSPNPTLKVVADLLFSFSLNFEINLYILSFLFFNFFFSFIHPFG